MKISFFSPLLINLQFEVGFFDSLFNEEKMLGVEGTLEISPETFSF